MERLVSFQGYDIEANKILEDDIRLDQLAQDSWGDVSLSNRNIQIGQKINLSKDYNIDYYIPRTIVLSSTNNETQQFLIEKEFIRLALLEDENQSLEETTEITSTYVGRKLFILSEQAWMGKTSVSSSLADEMKRSHPHFWVTRFVATDCASDLNHFDESTTSDEIYEDFFMTKLLKLSSLEKIVFGQYLKNEKSVNKFVIIFDGYNEINPKCQRVINNLLQYLSRKPNAGFILITTTPHFEQDLEKYFQQRACSLNSFDEQNKTDFLRRYWTSKGITKNPNKLTKYTEILITDSIPKKLSQLTDNFLQLRMIAEVYEKEAQCYVQNEANDLDASVTSLGLFDFYEKFIQIKKENRLNNNIEDMDTPFIQYVLKTDLENQSRFARELILRQSNVPKVEASDLVTTTQFGIIKRNQEGTFDFIDRTFAEFLTAEYLIEEIIENDTVPVADKIKNGLLIEEIEDCKLRVVRLFLNSKLNTTKLAEECKRSEDKITLQKLLGEKCIAIIVTSAEEEVHEFLKLTIEVNCWLEPDQDQIYKKLKDALRKAENNSKCLTAILNSMLDKWVPSRDIILLKTVGSLILNILVNCEDHGAHRKELTTSTIEFMNALKKAVILTEERLRIILSNAKGEVNRGGYWNWHTIEFFDHLLSTHQNLFYDFLNDNRSLLYNIMKSPNDVSFEFLEMLENDKNINADWIFGNFVEQKFTEFTEWEGDHFQSYLTILHHTTAGRFNAERLVQFRCYLEEVIQIIYQQFDFSWTELYSEFLSGYERIISLDQIKSKFNKTKTAKDLEYCALWGQTEKLKEILATGDIERAAIERFQLVGGTEDLADIRRRILNSIGERQGGEEAFLQMVQQRNWRKSTILQNALWRGDDLNIEQISTWITSQEIFEVIMTIDDRLGYIQSEVVSFLNFVNERYPEYRMRFLEINKNVFILMSYGTEEIFRIIENDENMSNDEFVKISKLQVDSSDYKGTTIIHDILARGELNTLKKLLYFMKKFSLDAESITQLFSIEDIKNVNPLDSIKYDSTYIRRQKKKELLFDFFNDQNLIELRDKISIEVGSANDNVQEIQPAEGFLRRFTRRIQSLIL